MQCDECSSGKILDVEGMSFAYAEKANLSDISIEIEPGEFVAILGKNGSGKTTLMRCVNKILKIKGGSVRICDEDIATLQMGEIAKLCTTVPADAPVDFSLKVRDFVALGRTPFVNSLWWENAEDERIINQAMYDFGIEMYADRRLHELSSGERARVLLAKGVVQTPKLMLVDEPSAHLDIKYKVQVMELLKMLSEKGMAILMANHDINLLTRFCDRILLLHDGKIIADGKPNDVVTQENIRKVFDIEVEIVQSGGVNYVLPTGSTGWDDLVR